MIKLKPRVSVLRHSQDVMYCISNVFLLSGDWFYVTRSINPSWYHGQLLIRTLFMCKTFFRGEQCVLEPASGSNVKSQYCYFIGIFSLNDKSSHKNTSAAVPVLANWYWCSNKSWRWMNTKHKIEIQSFLTHELDNINDHFLLTMFFLNDEYF